MSAVRAQGHKDRGGAFTTNGKRPRTEPLRPGRARHARRRARPQGPPQGDGTAARRAVPRSTAAAGCVWCALADSRPPMAPREARSLASPHSSKTCSSSISRIRPNRPLEVITWSPRLKPRASACAPWPALLRTDEQEPENGEHDNERQKLHQHVRTAGGSAAGLGRAHGIR